MKIPEGIQAKRDYVCKLNKSLYGFKQSVRCWFERYDNILKEHSFKNSEVDHCLYFLNNGHVNIYVLLYVDDLVIVTHNMNTMINFKSYLMKQFDMVDFSEIIIFLGIKVERTEDKIILDQISYLKFVLNKFSVNDCKSVETPLPIKLNYTALNFNKYIYYKILCKNLIGFKSQQITIKNCYGTAERLPGRKKYDKDWIY